MRELVLLGSPNRTGWREGKFGCRCDDAAVTSRLHPDRVFAHTVPR